MGLNMMGSLEAWLSLRTLHLRVPRQSENATGLAQWLAKAAGGNVHDGIPAGVIEKLEGGHPTTSYDCVDAEPTPVFARQTTKDRYAALLPHAVKYFIPATSLDGVEELMEPRITSDPRADPRLVHLSVGVEELEDLKDDLRRAFQEIVKSTKAKL
ncbi:hypothetical protein LXA43DRAFT_1102710 [Ganoderma leucocontextum]|nr:hypothetical protein LXA43DRAFT_1102710 [Ganoderma leucocontextum]